MLGYFSIPVVSCCAPSSKFTVLSLERFDITVRIIPSRKAAVGAHSGVSHSKERMTSSAKSHVGFADACTHVHMCESRHVC